MLKKLALVVLVFLFVYTKVFASHLMGGEITWECVKSGPNKGKFVFNMKLYRDCNGNAGPTNVSLLVYNHPAVSSIPLNLLSQTDISPKCNSDGPNITCAKGGDGAVQEFVFQSSPLTLSGIPGPKGWVFAYSDFFRNATIMNLQKPNTVGFTLRAVMYAYKGQNMDPCYDSSPKFLENPKTVICNGYPFTYNHNAIDPELDSLTYDWAEPLDQISGPDYNPPINPVPIAFTPGYSYTSPLPGKNLDPRNVPAAINPFTGEISYTSFTSGYFVTAIKVQAWKDKILIAEVYRELQIILLSCGFNSPPSVTAPFKDKTGAYTVYADTVPAGTMVNFSITATDIQNLPNGNPQTLIMEATGNQFGTNFSSTTAGCLNAPCATLNPALPAAAPATLSTTFSWQTDCSHIAYDSTFNTLSNTYNFVIKTQDDFCPAPAATIATISITILAKPIVPSPQLKCAAVAPNGDVTLTWLNPADTAKTFNSYHIYAATNANGPFKVVDSISNYNQTTYTHIGAQADKAPVFYFIRSRSGCFGRVYAPAKDTIKTIFLELNNSGTGIAALKWNPLSQPDVPTSTGIYKVYREYPAGTWTMIHATKNLNYSDTIAVCSALVNYRVEIGDSTGCTSVSSIAGSVFKDLLVPAIPHIDTVSVDVAGKATIGWNVSTSKDVNAYIIYKEINGFWTPIDTVWGSAITEYTNTASNANQVSEKYRIAAIDSCGNTSPLGEIQNTIFLTQKPDVCNLENQLNWNDYLKMNPSLGGYNVLVSENGGPYSILTVNAPGSKTYIHKGLKQASTYCYIIQAFDDAKTKTSSSNKLCYTASVLKEPVFSYLRFATVPADNQVDLSCYVDTAAKVSKYTVLRAETMTGPFIQVGSIQPDGKTQLSFTDLTALTDVQSYCYRVVAVDSCGVDRLSTNIGKTILLTAVANESLSNTLTWNDYELWLGNVNAYNIYRAIDGLFDPAPIATINFTNSVTNTFIDDITPYSQGSGVFSYYVEAVEGTGNPHGFSELSRSNTAEVYHDPLVYIPNAFAPAGVNMVFMPKGIYMDPNDYQLLIFNRFGELIFETHDPLTGWDGTYKQQKVQVGVYVYSIKYKSARGQYIERKGTVTLLR